MRASVPRMLTTDVMSDAATRMRTMSPTMLSAYALGAKVLPRFKNIRKRVTFRPCWRRILKSWIHGCRAASEKWDSTRGYRALAFDFSIWVGVKAMRGASGSVEYRRDRRFLIMGCNACQDECERAIPESDLATRDWLSAVDHGVCVEGISGVSYGREQRA